MSRVSCITCDGPASRFTLNGLEGVVSDAAFSRSHSGRKRGLEKTPRPFPAPVAGQTKVPPLRDHWNKAKKFS